MGSLKSFQIAIAWMENECKNLYIWFLTILYNKVYNVYNCLPSVFMSNRDQSLRNASKFFQNDDNYEVFKNKVKALDLTFDKKNIELAIESVKQVAKKACNPKKPLAYVKSLMKDSKLWIYADTKYFCHMGISTTACAKMSYSAFKRAIETASDLNLVFEKID
ncbi:449_t:CDS:2 [Cetraspora pellucida]|uniref:449_t:CDS:1 n=1 Tax=Cetraspora pellucida TaxID=1433469 RepID=A0A9N9GRA1_9GLOM|nr:449_t:CDS:2 [Cetraspora pellucida]